MASTIITTNADALKRAARKISTHPGTLNPNHMLNALSAAIAGPGKNWGFLQGTPNGHYVQPGLSASQAAAPSWILVVEGKGAYPCVSKGQALDAFSVLAEHTENKAQAEMDLMLKGTATLVHPEYNPVRVSLSQLNPDAPVRLHDSPPVRPGVPLTNQVLDQLRAFAGQRRSMIVSGVTGIGKTTLLEQISWGIPQEDKVVSIEFDLELMLHCAQLVRYETKHGSVRSPLRQSVKMAPRWVVLGEATHPDAFADLIKIGASGHAILSTMHSGSPASAVRRIYDNLKMENPERSDRGIKKEIVDTGLISITLHRGAEGEPRRIEAASISLGAEQEFVFTPIEF